MRVENWSKRLADAIESAREEAFAYGIFDCCIFSFDCAQAITGEDKAAHLRGYESKADALRIIAKYGSLEAMVSSLLGVEPKHVAFAKRGDLILTTIDEGEEPGAYSIGVCDGVRFWVPTLNGLTTRPTLQAIKAWSVD
jgi:hypothetical protein